MYSDQVSPPVLEHLDDCAESLDQAERIKQCVEFLLNNSICTNILGKLIGAMRTRKVSMRKVLEKKVLNLKMHPRVVLTARRRHLVIESIALDNVVRLGLVRVGIMYRGDIGFCNSRTFLVAPVNYPIFAI